jgi:hypothetical protein
MEVFNCENWTPTHLNELRRSECMIHFYNTRKIIQLAIFVSHKNNYLCAWWVRINSTHLYNSSRLVSSNCRIGLQTEIENKFFRDSLESHEMLRNLNIPKQCMAESPSSRKKVIMRATARARLIHIWHVFALQRVYINIVDGLGTNFRLFEAKWNIYCGAIGTIGSQLQWYAWPAMIWSRALQSCKCVLRLLPYLLQPSLNFNKHYCSRASERNASAHLHCIRRWAVGCSFVVSPVDMRAL